MKNYENIKEVDIIMYERVYNSNWFCYNGAVAENCIFVADYKNKPTKNLIKGNGSFTKFKRKFIDDIGP